MKNKNKQTKFPVARIKRIMQKDEEVGKVAQATPVVISDLCGSFIAKALELFLSMIVEESSKVTLERGAKRVEAYHLKHAVETVDMLDFLKEIVEAVPDPSAGGTIDLEAEPEKEKKKRSKGKKPEGAGEGSAAPRKRRRKAAEKKEEDEMDEDREEEDEEEEQAPKIPYARRKPEDDDYER
ncbi:histone-fold-containing protein [Panus rudis PR-1116 ss-1]|nr:histone-fold-containing protein [Panus rudis PR-1116 ss-1]